MAFDNLLTICQNVADTVGVERPGAIINNTEITAKRLKQFASRSIRTLAKRHDWAILQKEHTFNTAASDDEYDLPADYDRMIDDTTWDRANYWKYRSRLSPQEWQKLKSGLVNNAQLRKGYRLKADSRVKRFFIDPTPSSVEAQVFEYISDELVVDSGNTTAYEDWNADTDLPLFDSLLIELDVTWRMLNQLGLPYLEEKNEFENMFDAITSKDQGMDVVSLNAPPIDQTVAMTPEGDFTL